MILICEDCSGEFESDRKTARLCYKCLEKKLVEVVAERDELKKVVDVIGEYFDKVEACPECILDPECAVMRRNCNVDIIKEGLLNLIAQRTER